MMLAKEQTQLRDQRTMATSDDRLGDSETRILVGKGEEPAWLTLALANMVLSPAPREPEKP